MPRLNPARTVASEAALAKRLATERKRLGLGVEAVAKLMTEAGCAITGSAIYRMERGEPPRRISFDEAVALSRVFDIPLEDLATPIDQVLQRRALAIAGELPLVWERYEDALISALRLYREYHEIARDSEDLREFMHHQMDTLLARHDDRHRVGVDLPHVTDEELQGFRLKVDGLWSDALWLAQESAYRETDSSLRPEGA